MKKTLFIFILFSSIIFTGCANDQQVNIAQNQVDLFAKRNECMDICWKLYENEKKDAYVWDLFGTTPMTPEYVYNESKDACFMDGGMITVTQKNNFTTKWIKNCQTNQTVLIFSPDSSDFCNATKFNCASTLEDYNIIKQEFMWY